MGMMPMAVSAKPIESRDAERCCEIAVRATTAVAFLKVKTNLPTNLAGMLEQFDRSLQARKDRPVDLGSDLQFNVSVIRLQSQHMFFKGLQLLGLWGSNANLCFGFGRYHVDEATA